MDCSLIDAFDSTGCSVAKLSVIGCSLDLSFLGRNICEDSVYATVKVRGRIAKFSQLAAHISKEIILECNSQLIFETVAPVGVFGKEFHGVVETALQEMLRHLQALELVHGINLLFALCPCDVECLVLLLDPGNFALDFLHPLVV